MIALTSKAVGRLPVQRYFCNQGIIWDHHRTRPEQGLQVVRQLAAACSTQQQALAGTPGKTCQYLCIATYTTMSTIYTVLWHSQCTAMAGAPQASRFSCHGAYMPALQPRHSMFADDQLFLPDTVTAWQASQPAHQRSPVNR